MLSTKPCLIRYFTLPILALSGFLIAEDRPNVLFIIADDLRNELGCYGSEIAITPHIDALSASGLRFDRAYCQKAVCWPSRNSLLSGLLPGNLGQANSKVTFRASHPNITSLPQHFKNHGYHTSSFGKILHNGQDDPLSWSQPHFDPPPLQYARPENREKHPIINRSVPENNINPLYESAEVDDEAYEDGLTTAKAVEELQRRAKRETPFFLIVGFHKPHSPFNAPKRDWDLYPDVDIPLSPFPAHPKGAPQKHTHHPSNYLRSFAEFPASGEIPDDEARQTRHAYLACVSYIDRLTGKLLDALDQSGLRENTIIVFTSDHGYHLGDQALWSKHSTFELATRVPLIFSGPDIAKGETTMALVELVDLFPTLLDCANLEVPVHLEGVTFSHLLTDSNKEGRKAAFSEYSRGGARGLSIRSRDYRYTEWRDLNNGRTVEREFYDLRKQSVETRNLSGDRAFSDLMEKHAELLKARLD